MMIICLIIPTTLWRALMACATPGQSPSLSPPRKEPCRSVVTIGTTFLRSSRCCSVVARRVVGRVCLTRLSRQILKLSAFFPSYGGLLILHTDLTLLSRQHLGLSALCPCHGGLLSLLIIDYLSTITCNNYASLPQSLSMAGMMLDPSLGGLAFTYARSMLAPVLSSLLYPEVLSASYY